MSSIQVLVFTLLVSASAIQAQIDSSPDGTSSRPTASQIWGFNTTQSSEGGDDGSSNSSVKVATIFVHGVEVQPPPVPGQSNMKDNSNNDTSSDGTDSSDDDRVNDGNSNFASRIPLPAGTVIPVSSGTSYLLIISNGTIPGQRRPWVVAIANAATDQDSSDDDLGDDRSGDLAQAVQALNLPSGVVIPVKRGATAVVVQTDGSAMGSTQFLTVNAAMQGIVPYEVPSSRDMQSQYVDNRGQPSANAGPSYLPAGLGPRQQQRSRS